MCRFFEAKLRCAELIGFLLGFALRADPGRGSVSLDLYAAYLAPLSDVSASQLFLTEWHHATFRAPALFHETAKYVPATQFEQTAEFFTLLVDQSRAVLSETRQRMYVRRLYKRAILVYTNNLECRKALTAKAYKRIFREFSTNGGPWCTFNGAEHWRACNVFDSGFRRTS